ncbi:MAG: hypothetical protein GTO63_30095 [Anaerolineae bacterium]|nr:hypothetical protein [Anaerolineae bacterium]NIN98957.1 hypothetical protein [Anaerolineae bacterium]
MTKRERWVLRQVLTIPLKRLQVWYYIGVGLWILSSVGLEASRFFGALTGVALMVLATHTHTFRKVVEHFTDFQGVLSCIEDEDAIERLIEESKNAK